MAAEEREAETAIERETIERDREGERKIDTTAEIETNERGREILEERETEK